MGAQIYKRWFVLIWVHKWWPHIIYLCLCTGHRHKLILHPLWRSKICLERRSRESLARIYYVAPASSPQFSFSIVKLPSESAKFIVTRTLWQGRMWDYYKSFSDKKYIFGSKKLLFNTYSGRKNTLSFCCISTKFPHGRGCNVSSNEARRIYWILYKLF